MSDNIAQSILQNTGDSALCQQVGYLPVPLRNIPFEALAGLSLYLLNNNSYTLYRDKKLEIRPEDISRLLEANTEFAYVPVKDHQLYYQTIENGLCSIVSDPQLKNEKKAEILYSTCIALVDQLYDSTPESLEINRVENVSRALVEMIVQDKDAFKHLFDVSNHDFYTATHMVNVCTTLVALGQHMHLTQQELQEIGTGALLHDIGNLFIPKHLLNTADKLTDEEFRIMKSHVSQGVTYLQENASLSLIAMAVVSEHHERLDGSGYPHGLKGNDISLYGRMAGVVDTYEAMTSVRPYRDNSFSLHDVTAIFHEDAPEKYDERVINEFCNMVENDIIGDDPQPDDESFEIRYTPGCFIKRLKRFYFRMPMIIRIVEKVGEKLRVGPEKKIIVHNMSQSGIALLSPRPMKIGQNIHITIPGLNGIQTKPIVAIVIRCQSHGDGWYTIGSKFHREPPADLIENIKTVTVVMEEFANSV